MIWILLAQQIYGFSCPNAGPCTMRASEWTPISAHTTKELCEAAGIEHQDPQHKGLRGWVSSISVKCVSMPLSLKSDDES